MKKWFEWFLGSNDLTARLLRTIVESVFSFLLVNVDVLFAQWTIPADLKLVIMGVLVAIISPILASLRQKSEKKEE